MQKHDLAFVVVGESHKEIHKLFIAELQNHFTDIGDFASLFDLNVSVQKIPEINWVEFLKTVDNEFVIFQQDDMIFYDHVDSNMIRYYLEIIKGNEQIDCIRLSRAGLSQKEPEPFASGVCKIPDDEPYPFCLSANLWRTSSLLKLFEESSQYSNTHNIFRIRGMNGLFAYNQGDTKRGMYHWENQFYPFMNTAMINDEWNEAEYGIEIENLKREYATS